jgi:dTDP-4-amino-4,6-dideoxygalactose transaminase
MTKKVKLFKPFVSPKAIKNVVEVLQGTQLAEGPRVKEFEAEFGKKFGLKNVAAVNSGTAALELAYEIAGIGEGDEVITPVLTCTATNIPLIHRKATIVFADTDKDLNVSISDIKKKITPKTKAIVFVHFGGNNRGLKELLKLCKEKKIVLIEDAAQAVGSDFWGKADFTCVSLQAIKTLTSGDGGFIICKNKDDHAKAKRLRWFGYDRDAKQRLGDTDLVEAGYKYHMNDITAAIGLGNLAVVDKLINHRKKLMAIYREAGFISNIWMTAVLDDYAFFKEKLLEHGYETGQHHYRNDKYSLFGGRKKFPMMDEIEKNYFFVPMHHDVTLADAKKIVKIIKTAKR